MSDKKLKALYKELKNADDIYYNSDKEESPLSDSDYDKKREYLENNYKTIEDKSLKTKIKKYLKGIGSKVRESKRNTILPFLIGSLAKVTKQKLARLKTIIKFLEKPDYIVGPKIDGTSITLQYKKGILVNAFSRGDGELGQSKLEHIKQIEGIPHVLSINDTVHIRGDAVLKESVFNKKFKNKTIDGKKYKEARNACSGWINSDEANSEIAKCAMFIAYELLDAKGEAYKNAEITNKVKALNYLNSVFKNKYLYTQIKTMDSLDNLIEFLEEKLKTTKESLDYQIDGLVFEINSYLIRKTINANNKTKYPKFAVAYKVSADDAVVENGVPSVVSEITRTVNKTGLNFPTINFNPVKIGNSNITKASGVHYAHICCNGFQPGTKILVIKAGDVIPKVYLNEKPKEIKPPKTCLCGAKALVVEGIKPHTWNLYCSKPQKCKYAKQDNLASTLKSLGLTGLGNVNIQKLFDAGYTDIFELLSAKEKNLLKIEGFGDSLITTIKVGIPQKLKSLPKSAIMECSGVFIEPGLSLARKTLEEILSGKINSGLRYELYLKHKSEFKDWYKKLNQYL